MPKLGIRLMIRGTPAGSKRGIKSMFNIRPIPNKGRGVFATVPIQNGSVIMRDPIALVYETQDNLQQRFRKFLRLAPKLQEEVLKLAVHRNEEECVDLFLKLDRSGERHNVISKMIHLHNVLKTNAFCTVPDDPESPRGLFLNASRFNHSCVPNADHTCNDKSHSASFVANKAIDKDEEITISYINPAEARAQRLENLRVWVSCAGGLPVTFIIPNVPHMNNGCYASSKPWKSCLWNVPLE